MTRWLRSFVFLAALAGLATTLPGDVPCCELRYRLTPDPTGHAVEVTLEIRGFRGESLLMTRASSRPLPGLLGEDPLVDGGRPAAAGGDICAGSGGSVHSCPGLSACRVFR